MKNKYSIQKFEIISTVFILILGTILHFTFEWSNNNIFVGAFSAVNESVWEHLKLVFFPMLVTTIIGELYFKDSIHNYLCAKTYGIIIAMAFIVIFFYTYTGIIGKNLAILDIGSFFIAVFLGQYISIRMFQSKSKCNKFISVSVLAIILLCFVSFTFVTPKIGIFEDSLTNTYGIQTQ